MLIHPAIAESCATALAGASSGSGDGSELSTAAVEGPELLLRFGAVSDGRSEQGRDHPVAVVLTLCAAAVLGGMRSFTAIAGWVADVPAEVLARLYARPARYPSKTTLWRVLTGADAAAVDAAIGAWLLAQATAQAARQRALDAGDSAGAALVAVAVDGKTVRGAVDADGARMHLLAAAPTPTRWSWPRSRSARRPTRCAARRPVVSLIQLGGTRKTVLGSDGLPGAER